MRLNGFNFYKKHFDVLTFCRKRTFTMRKTKTYMDKLMENKEFREKFDKEYRNLCVGEKIAKIRHRANLRQDDPVNRRKNNKPF